MESRNIGTATVPAIGLGCMNLSHAYGVPPDERDAVALLHRAFELGVRHFDTAALYGFGANESLVGKAMKSLRSEIHLASKCGMTGVDGKRVIDGRPETLVKTIDESLQRLQTDHIDLYYLHRWDKTVPIEDSVGALAEMVSAGKIGGIGLSEVSANTLHKAHAVHPVTAVQTEYSLWTRNAELACLETCRELGVAFVAFSPLARGFLAAPMDPTAFAERDIRRGMPRFQEPAFSDNAALYKTFASLSEKAGVSTGELALAWVLSRGEHIVAIPGTRSMAHLEENVATLDLSIDASVLAEAGALINQSSVAGPRYPAATQVEIDTEEFQPA